MFHFWHLVHEEMNCLVMMLSYRFTFYFGMKMVDCERVEYPPPHPQQHMCVKSCHVFSRRVESFSTFPPCRLN